MNDMQIFNMFRLNEAMRRVAIRATKCLGAPSASREVSLDIFAIGAGCDDVSVYTYMRCTKNPRLEPDDIKFIRGLCAVEKDINRLIARLERMAPIENVEVTNG